MKKSLRAARPAVFALSLLAAACPAFAADEIPVRRVILSTSGLAHFELRAKVDGDAALEFPVRLAQVDDILKSLVVFDEKGQLGGVTLPGKQPLAQMFRDLPFSQDQLQNPMLLLNAYQGAEVTVEEAGASTTGKILNVSPETTQTEDGMVTRHRLSLLADAGIKQIVLEDAQGVHFDDAKIRAEILRALDAVRENGTADQRSLTVNLTGSGPRDVALSYVVDAPLWKAAYRLVLPEGEKEEGLLQGWAVIENMTAADWADVDLTLVSGNPVTYRQALYESYYVERPEIPVEVFGRVMPRVDTGSLTTAEQMEGDAQGAIREEKRARRDLMKSNAPMAVESMMAMDAAAPAPAVMGGFASGAANMAQGINAAQSSEATTQVLFRFPSHVTLRAGQSLMLPFVSRKVPMERVSLYQPETHATHPLAAVSLSNDGDSGLPPGILTLYEESAALKGTSFVGDAQLPMLGQDEKRMIGYALDSKTTISREDKSTSTEDRISISEGILRISIINHSETVYTVKAPPNEDRMVVIEHPKMQDYKVVTPDPKEVEVTETHYRVRVPVKAGETKTQAIALEQTAWQSWALTDMPAEQMLAYVHGGGKLDPETRRSLEKLAEVRREIDTIDRGASEIEQQKQQIFQDQERVRENLKSLEGKSDVQQKYLEKLSAQEDQIAELDKAQNKLAEQRAELAKKLAEMISEMKL